MITILTLITSSYLFPVNLSSNKNWTTGRTQINVKLKKTQTCHIHTCAFRVIKCSDVLQSVTKRPLTLYQTSEWLFVFVDSKVERSEPTNACRYKHTRADVAAINVKIRTVDLLRNNSRWSFHAKTGVGQQHDTEWVHACACIFLYLCQWPTQRPSVYACKL